MALAARDPRAAVAGIGGQQLLQHAAARLQHPGADHRLGSLEPGVTAAQRPGRLRRQAETLLAGVTALAVLAFHVRLRVGP